MIKYLLRELAGIVSMLRNIKILTALLFLINTANAQTVSPPTCSINGATITCPNGSLIPGGVPGGSNTQIQFNDSGAFGGSSLFTFNKTTGQISNNQGILTTSSPFTITQTWNSGGTTFTGIMANVTDTASASGSLLMDLQKGGTSLFAIDKNGQSTAISSQIASAGLFTFSSRSRLASPADGQITLYNNAQTGFTRLNFGGTTGSFPALKVSGTQLQVRLGDDTGYSVIAPSALILQGQTTLGSDAADTLAQRNGTNAQTFRVYNTYTDASNYERGVFDWSTTANTLTIGTTQAGTGASRNIQFIRAGSNALLLSGGTAQLGSLNLNWSSDNANDIGASGANRPRTGYFGTSLIVGTTTTIGGSTVTTGGSTAIPAGGSNALGFRATSTANFGVFFGSGAPTLSAAKGSLYLRSDGTTTNDRAYVNTDGGTTWTNVVTGG